MKETIKEFLDELLIIGTTKIDKKIFKKVFNLGDDQIFWSVKSDILEWQENIYFDVLYDGQFPDYLLIEDYELVKKRYHLFFEHCPEVEELFLLNKEENKLSYNPALTPEEKREIVEYIITNFKPRVFINRKS
jgi:hypothetical protein